MQDMVSFWDGYRQHFAAFGVNVCPVLERQYWGLPSLLTATAPLPFAFHCDHSTMEGPVIVSRHWRSFNVSMSCLLSSTILDVGACRAGLVLPRIRADGISSSSS